MPGGTPLKMFLLILAIMILTLAGVTYIGLTGVEEKMVEQQQQQALNILRLVMLDIRDRYDNLVRFKLETIARRRQTLKQAASTAWYVIHNFYQSYQNGQITETEARKKVSDG